MINNPAGFDDSWLVPEYRVTRLRRQIDQPSFGNLGKLPPELLCMVFPHLTCADLEALHCCSTGGRIAVLACFQYSALLNHAPKILAILKETGLDRWFTIGQIFETFTSPLCTTCGRFGAYVFLPSFTRCCMLCAETDMKYMPVSRNEARIEFGVKRKKVLDGLPQLSNIEGYYSSFSGQIKYYTQRLSLISRELAEQVRSPKHRLDFPRQSMRYVGENSVQAHQRYMALTPLPCFIPKSGSIENGVYCSGCDLRAKEHGFCKGTHMGEYRTYQKILHHLTDGLNYSCWPRGYNENCFLITEQDRLHDSRHVLSHLQGCAAAQALLEAKWTRSQKKASAVDS